jgi:serine/threonine-protein kinase
MGTRGEDGRVFFTMDLVEGETLTNVIDTLHEAPLVGADLERVLLVILKVCDAVEFAHSRGVIHRDIKPDNIMVGGHGQVYLMDWGVALERGEPASRGVVGTAAYMSPEQAWGKVTETDERSDIYGLGGILYEILTGRGPHFSEDTREALQHARAGTVEPPEHLAIWPELPPGLCQIALKAMAGDPADRYQCVAELRTDIQQFLRGGGWFSTRDCRPGEVIISEGDAAESAYIIVEGRCEVVKMIGGETVSVRELGPGEVFGETAVLTNQARTATVVAVGRAVLKVVTRESLEAELQRNPWLGAFVRALAERFRDVDSQLTKFRERHGDTPTG